MTKSSKKTAIAAAILVVVMCTAIIAGATFALFTSTVTNDINVNTGDIKVTGSLTLDEAWSQSEEGAKTNATVSGNSATVQQGGTVSVNSETGAITFNKISLGDGAKFTLSLNIVNSIRAKYAVELQVAEGADSTFLKDNLKVAFGDSEAALSENAATVSDWKVLEINESGTQVDITFTISLPWTSTGIDAEGAQSIKLQLVTKAVQANASSGKDFETGDGTGYDTITEAIQNAKDGDTVMINANNITMPSLEELTAATEGKKITISGKGSDSSTGTKITGTSNVYVPANVTLENVYSQKMIQAVEGCTLRNVKMNNKINIRANTAATNALSDDDTTNAVVIDSCTFTSVNLSANGVSAIVRNCTLTVTGCPVSASNSSRVVLENCSFSLSSGSKNVIEAYSNSTVVAKDSTFTLSSKISLSKPGSVIKLSGGSQGFFENCTINNINNLSGNGNSIFVTEGADITMNNCTVNSTPAALAVYNENENETPTATLTNTNMTVTGENLLAVTVGVHTNEFNVKPEQTRPAGSPGKLVMDGGSIIATGTDASAIYASNSSYVELNNATVTSDSFAFSTNNVYGGETELTITGSSAITSNKEVALYLPALKTFTMTGGTVKGAAAMDVRLGTIEITGGELISTATDNKVLQYVSGEVSADGVNGGSNPDGSTVIVNSCIYKLDGEIVPLNITISDDVAITSATRDEIHVYDWNQFEQDVTTSFGSHAVVKYELKTGAIPDRVA